MQVKCIVECLEHSAIFLTFIKLPFVIVIKIYVLSIFEWPFDPTPWVESVSVGNIFATMLLQKSSALI